MPKPGFAVCPVGAAQDLPAGTLCGGLGLCGVDGPCWQRLAEHCCVQGSICARRSAFTWTCIILAACVYTAAMQHCCHANCPSAMMASCHWPTALRART